MIARISPQEHWGWLVARARLSLTHDFCALEAVDEDGAVRGMVGFDNWLPNSVRMHVSLASPVAGRALLIPAFAFPFLQRNVGVVWGSTPASNSKSRALCRGLGFRETHRVKDGYLPGNDMVVFEMTRDECRWLPGAHRKAA